MASYDTVHDFGLFYDSIPLYVSRADVKLYVDEAERAGSSSTVLELGCGTGRILLPLARAGHSVTGIDRSPAMLARCRAKLASEPDTVRNRVTLHEADVRSFSLLQSGGAEAVPGFALAIAPFRVLQHLTTIADQLQCLAAVRTHLAPGGRFAFDVFNPNFSLMTQDRSAEVEDTPELPLDDGRYLRRTVRVVRQRFVDQESDIEIVYYVRTGTAVERFVQAFPMRWYLPAELEQLLARAGFHIEAVYGDMDRAPLTDKSPDIIVVASRME